MWSTKTSKSKRKRLKKAQKKSNNIQQRHPTINTHKKQKKQKANTINNIQPRHQIINTPKKQTKCKSKTTNNNKVNSPTADHKNAVNPQNEEESKSEIVKIDLNNIKEYLPSLQATYIIPDIISSLNIKSIDPRDDHTKIQILDTIISKLTQNMLSQDNANKSAHYSLSRALSLEQNKKLLCYGYGRQTSPIYIPTDILDFFFKFYNNSITWTIKDDQMTKFLNSVHKETIYGPTIEITDSMTVQLSVCPKGWRSVDEGYTACYLEVIKFPETVKNITIMYTLYLREMDHQHIRTVMYPAYNANGWDAHGLSFEEIEHKLFDSLHIECGIEVIHIEYHEMYGLKNYISFVPELKDTEFTWYITDNLLNEIQTKKKYRRYYSNTFYNNCWVLSFLPFGLYVNRCSLGIKLLKLPFGSNEVMIKADLIASCDLKRFEKIVEGRFGLNRKVEYFQRVELFDSSLLESLSCLSFTVKIKVYVRESSNA